MSRRRRQRNPLLIRIVMISLAAHVVALPILAHFGAFDKVRKSFGTANIVMLEPEKKVVQPPPVAKKKVKAQTKNADKGQNKGKSSAARKDLTKVAVQEGPGTGTGPVVDQGTNAGGGLPPGVSTDKNKSGGTGDTKTTTTPPAVKPLDKPNTSPPSTDKSTVTEPPVKPKHTPVYTEVEPVFQPEPTIPDDLRSEPLDKTAVIEVTIEADGSIATAALSQGTGIKELDDIAMKTAKTWRFKPATADGEAVTGKLRLRIEFKVE